MEIILASVLFAYYFVNIAKIPKWIKDKLKLKQHQRIKPIDCSPCLSVWIALILYFTNEQIVHFILILFASGCIGTSIIYIIQYLQYKSKIF